MSEHITLKPIRTQSEVADIMTARGFPMTRSNVQQTEKRALRKLRNDPEIRSLVSQLWEDHKEGTEA